MKIFLDEYLKLLVIFGSVDAPVAATLSCSLLHFLLIHTVKSGNAIIYTQAALDPMFSVFRSSLVLHLDLCICSCNLALLLISKVVCVFIIV